MSATKKLKLEAAKSGTNNNNSISPSLSASDYENILLKEIANHPEGVHQSLLEEKYSGENWFGETLTALYESTKIVLFRDQQNQLVFKQSAQTTDVSGLNEDERSILRAILSFENKGVTTKDLKAKVDPNLAAKIPKLTRNLQKKQLVKLVACVNKTRKVWMGIDIEPSAEISGDIWFHEGELDLDFIDSISKTIYDFIEDNKVASASEIFSGVKSKVASSVKLNHVQELLNILKWDGKLEPFEDSASGTSEIRYRIRQVKNFSSGLVKVPCSTCSHFRDCSDDSIINPKSCIYLKNWIKDIEDF